MPSQKDAVFPMPLVKPSSKPAKDTAQTATIPKYARASLPQAATLQKGVATGKKKQALQEDGTYEELLRLWFAEHQPASLSVAANHQQHRVMVRITVNSNGAILRKSIEKSSENKFFDNAALAIVASSSPVPAPPLSEDEGTEVEFLVPIIF
jgi:TonB family protein